MAAVALRPGAGLEEIRGEVNALIATPAASGNVAGSVALRIVRGVVAADGTATAGEGFTSAKNSTGDYTVTLTTAYAAQYAPLATPSGNPRILQAAYNSTSNFVVRTSDAAGLATDSGFSFLTVGAA